MENAFGLNWVDLVFIITIFYFAISNKGFLRALIDFSGFFFSLFASYSLYSLAANFFLNSFSLPKGLASVSGFFSIWLLSEFLFFLVAFWLLKKFLKKQNSSTADTILGFLLGLAQGTVLFLFFISLVFALPVRGQVKKDILDSKTGPFFVDLAHSFESEIKNVFGEAANETLNFLTVKPKSGTTIELGFKLTSSEISPDPSAESVMYRLVNKERQSRGINSLSFDNGLKDVAEKYAVQMLENGFFSHTSQVDGSDAGIRVKNVGISFGVLGENLAFAPDLYIAHQGLMNSQGHRENILSPEYRKVGVGVVDGGVYGKMFVQLFSD